MINDKRIRLYLAPWFARGGTHAEFLNACLTANLSVTRRLLKEDASLANIPSGEVTPLRLAAFYGHTELAELLIHHGADVNTVASDEIDYPLHIAAQSGHRGVIKVLLNHGAAVDALDRLQQTPLLRAAKMNHKEAIRILIEAGANTEHRGGYFDSTALQYAIFEGSAEAVGELVRLGADVNAETSKNSWLFFRLLSENQWPLLDACEGTRPLYMAICLVRYEIAELLLNHGADINALSFGWSALHAAVAMPDPVMVELLLRRGADPYVKANLKSLRGPAWNHQTPMDLLMGFRRTANLLRTSERKR